MNEKMMCFGYHADLHLWDDDIDAGKRANPDELEHALKVLNPDWVQVDSKGHPGMTSFFSRLPEATVAPHLQKDTVAAWREATRRLELPLYCHYSGFIDISAGRKHPEWLAVQSPEFPREEPYDWMKSWMCPRSDYWNELMIPQLLELVTEYQVDGFWLDSDTWGYKGCWCEKCRAEFTRRTGITQIPMKCSDPHWAEWRNFHYDSMLETIKHYVDAVHQAAPHVKVCTSWLDSIRYPVVGKTLPHDWLSGDTVPYGCLDATTRAEVRWLANRKKTWDLMSWPHLAFPDFYLKSHDMLCQEASTIISAGGRYNLCEYSGGVRTSQQTIWRMRRLNAVRNFIHERADFCYGAENIPEIAIISKGDFSENEIPFQNFDGVQYGTNCLLDNQYHVDVLDEVNILERLTEYKAVVVPETKNLPAQTVAALKTYVENGGTLLAVGVSAMENFGKEFFGIEEMEEEKISPQFGCRWNFTQKKDDFPIYFIGDETDGAFPVASKPWGLIKKVRDARFFGKVYRNYETLESDTGFPAAVIHRRGKGIAAAIPANYFTAYQKHFYLPEARKFLGRLLKELYPIRAIEVKSPSMVDVMFRQKDGVRLIHLLNRTCGSATSESRKMVDEIYPIGPVELQIRCTEKPESIKLLPENSMLDFQWTPDTDGGIASVTVSSVHIHCAVAVCK